MLRNTLLFALIVMLCGCSMTRKIDVPNDGVTVIDYTAEHRGAYLHVKDGNLSIVSEPSPDAAKEITASLGLKASSLEGIANPELKAEYANKVVDLASRSQSLQVLREAMYRLSEIGTSQNLKPDQIAGLYIKVLKTVETIALTEFANTIPVDARGEVMKQHLSGDGTGTITIPDNATTTVTIPPQ